MSSRSLVIAAVVSALILAGCAGDEKDAPDVTVEAGTPASPVTGAPTTVAVVTTGTTVADSGPNSTTTATTTVVPKPPVTCGPDPDETHPPPCD